MNVGELRALLDEYGDHLSVYVETSRDTQPIGDVSDTVLEGERVVLIELTE